MTIKISTQSAAEYKDKKPESLSLAAKRETKVRQRQDEDAEYLKTSGGFMPISVLMNQKQNNTNNGDDAGPNVPPNKAGDDDDHEMNNNQQ